MKQTAFDPSTTTPDQAKQLIEKIAEILGVEEPTHDEIDKTLDQLFAVVTGDASDDGSDLTESERRACRAQGCSFSDFRRGKAAFRRG